MNERFLHLLTRVLAGEASELEQQEWELLLKENPQWKKEAELYQQFWTENAQVPDKEVSDAYKRVSMQLGFQKETERKYGNRVRRMSGWTRIAAVFLIVLSSAAVLYAVLHQGRNWGGTGNIVKQTARGVKSIIELSDGSKIWLNSDSKVEYPPYFLGNTREISLEGEAFFEVAKNPAKPFIIHLAKGTVRVLGTSFNVRAYKDMPVVETSVVTGKVAFIPKFKNNKSGDTVFLLPDKKAIYQISNEKVSTLFANGQDAKAWTEGRLIFKSMTLEDISFELERNFGVHVEFSDEEPRNYRLTGSFQNNNLSEILYYLSKTKTFHYELDKDTLRITK